MKYMLVAAFVSELGTTVARQPEQISLTQNMSMCTWHAPLSMYSTKPLWSG